MYVCRKCTRSLDVNFFHKNRSKKNGLNPECKECASVRHKKRNALPENKVKKKNDNTEWVKTRLTNGFCKFCRRARLPRSSQFCEYHFLIDLAYKRLGVGTREVALLLKKKLDSQNYCCAYTNEPLVL